MRIDLIDLICSWFLGQYYGAGLGGDYDEDDKTVLYKHENCIYIIAFIRLINRFDGFF